MSLLLCLVCGCLLVILRVSFLVEPVLSDTEFFTDVPEPKVVFLGSTVNYTCSVILYGWRLSLQYTPNVGSIDEVSQTPFGNGTRITESFVVTQETNGTVVRCVAVNLSNKMVRASPDAIVLAEGPPTGMSVNFEGSPCYMSRKGFIVWHSIWSLLPLQYVVVVREPNGVIVNEVLSVTFHICELNVSGIYNVSVTPRNEIGVGVTTSVLIDYPGQSDEKLKVKHLPNLTVKHGNNNWTNSYQFENATSCDLGDKLIANISVTNCHINCTNAVQVSFSNQEKINSYSDLIPRNKYNTLIVVNYRNNTFHSETVDISTHDLQNLSLVNTSVGTMCLNFTVVSGHTIKDIHIHLERQNQSIPRMENVTVSLSHNSNYFISCFSDIPGDKNWTVKAFDGPAQDDNCSNPAKVLTNVIVESRDEQPSEEQPSEEQPSEERPSEERPTIPEASSGSQLIVSPVLLCISMLLKLHLWY